MGPKNATPLKLMQVIDELKMQTQTNWNVVSMDDLSRFSKAIANPTTVVGLITLVFGVMQAFKPTVKQLIQAEILDEFIKTWDGYLLSFSRSQDPDNFIRLLVDQIQTRKAKFQMLNASNGNLIMIFKFYVSLSVITHVKKDIYLDSNLDWLLETIIKMRQTLIKFAQSPSGLGTGDWKEDRYGVYCNDKFTNQFESTTGKRHNAQEFYKRNKFYVQQVKKSWRVYLLSLRKNYQN